MPFGYACDRCRQKHQSCDHQFPCQRCIKANSEDACHYTPKRPRSRKGSACSALSGSVNSGLYSGVVHGGINSLHPHPHSQSHNSHSHNSHSHHSHLHRMSTGGWIGEFSGQATNSPNTAQTSHSHEFSHPNLMYYHQQQQQQGQNYPYAQQSQQPQRQFPSHSHHPNQPHSANAQSSAYSNEILMLENELFSRELGLSNVAARNSAPACFPSSELLDGIHYSASKLYETVPEPYARYYGYDSSALLASGVFMQEYMREAINFISDDIRLAEGSGIGGNLILSPSSVMVSAASGGAGGNSALLHQESGVDIFGELALEKQQQVEVVPALTLQNIPPNGGGNSSKAAAGNEGAFYAPSASCSATGTLSHV